MHVGLSPYRSMIGPQLQSGCGALEDWKDGRLQNGKELLYFSIRDRTAANPLVA